MVDERTEQWAVAGDSVQLTLKGVDQAHVSIGCFVCPLAQPMPCVRRFRWVCAADWSNGATCAR